MKEVNYNGNLNNDIKIAKKEGKKGDLIIIGIISDILAIAFGLPTLYLLCRLFNVEFQWISAIVLTTLDTIDSIIKINKKIKERNLVVNTIKQRISFLVDDLNNNEELIDKYTNNINPTVSTKDVTNAITTKEETVEKNTPYNNTEKLAKSITTITTDFYMLDSYDQLKVLREVREHIKTDNKGIDTTNLYLLEKEDILPVLPIKRTLERK